MYLNITEKEANVIQVAIDHLRDEHKDVLADALKHNDSHQVYASYDIIKTIEDIHVEIRDQMVRYSGISSNV